jgi:hypothetical protein
MASPDSFLSSTPIGCLWYVKLYLQEQGLTKFQTLAIPAPLSLLAFIACYHLSISRSLEIIQRMSNDILHCLPLMMHDGVIHQLEQARIREAALHSQLPFCNNNFSCTIIA